MIRPFVWAICFLITGILCGQGVSLGVFFALFCGGIVIIIIGMIAITKSKLPFIYIVFFLAGYFGIQQQLQPTSMALEQIAAAHEMVEIRGTVIDFSVTETQRQSVTLESREILCGQEKIIETVKISLLLEEGQWVALWDILQVEGELLPLEEQSIPGGYDEKRYLSARGYEYKMYPEGYKVVGQEKHVLLGVLTELRENVKGVYDTLFPAAQSGVLKAMITGEKGEIDALVQERYTKAGITHILAISGLHISIISVYLLFFLEDLLRCNKKVSTILVLVSLLFYLCFSGCAPSAVRAVIMLSVGLIGRLFYYESDSLNNVAIAGIGILLVQPLYLWDIGFQLSFVTITGLLSGVRCLEKLYTLPKWFKNTIGVSFFASMSSFPIVAYYFSYVSVIGILVNVVILPLAGVLLSMGMLVGMIGLFCLPVASFCSGIVYFILVFYEKICILAEQVPYGYLLVGRPALFSIVLWYGIFCFLCYYEKRKPYYTYGVLLAEVVLLFSFWSNQLFFHKNKVTFLDVGQGDAIVVETYDKHTYIIDTGGTFLGEYGRNTGTRVVLPYLQQAGISHVDGLFLTHIDTDHSKGAVEVLEGITIDKLYFSTYAFEKTPLYVTLLKTAESYQVPVEKIHAGDGAILGGGMKLEVLYPYETMEYWGKDENQGSLVIQLTDGNTSLLLTGDAGIAEEYLMLQYEKEKVKSTILKVGHHGSKSSTSEKFLEAVEPEAAILSYGENNFYGHPHETVVERLKERNIALYRTAELGTITVFLEKNGYTIEGMKANESIETAMQR